MLKFFIRASLGIFTIYAAICLLYIWGGGYWENEPVLEYVSGRMRFAQFVSDPIPPGIYNLRGGYSGFPQGQVATFFQFDQSLKEQDFLTDWIEVKPVEKSSAYAAFGDEIGFSKLYKYKNQEDERYLILDDVNKKGILYMP
jgi:hypothetical protein